MVVFCDGSTCSAKIEKKCTYIMFYDIDSFEPVLTFLSLKDLPSQGADGIKSAINAAFHDISMSELASKVIFLASDSASVNSGIKSGLAVKFCQAGVSWLVFAWCLCHRLELALGDHLEEVMEPVKKCLTNLFYCYGNSLKKLWELQKLHNVLSELHQFEDGCVKPSKWSDTHWIAHLLCSMSCLVDNFGLYLQHFKNIIVDDSKSTDKTTLEGKCWQLTDSKVLLLSAFFIDILDPPKTFCVASQKNDFNVIKIADRLDDMIFSYQLHKKAFAKNPKTVFNLPHIDKVLMNIVCEQERGKKIVKYQDIKPGYFEQQKASLANNAKAYINMILEAIYEHFGGLSEDDTDLEGTPVAGDKFLCDICCILASRKWILL